MLIACSSRSSSEESKQVLDTALVKENFAWILRSPAPDVTCTLILSFHEDNKVVMTYRGQAFEGYYEIDPVLSNYITLTIFNKQGWDDACEINPEYLSLYDSDTQFSYTIIDNTLYFQKAEKSIVFERVESENLKKEVDQD